MRCFEYVEKYSTEALKYILDYGSVHGMFSERAHGYGKYDYVISEIKEND